MYMTDLRQYSDHGNSSIPGAGTVGGSQVNFVT